MEAHAVIAARDLEVGTALSEQNLVLAKIHGGAGEAPRRYFDDKKMLLGRTTILPVSKGDVIMPYEVGGYGDPIPPAGMRAVNVETQAVNLADGVQQGAQVDVFTAWTSRTHNVRRTTLLVKNAPVLAVTRKAAANSNDSGRMRETVTLLVSPDDAVKIAMTRSNGQIRISPSGADSGRRQ